MSAQEDWVRITLRLPGDLHRSLTEKARNSSLNAQIVGMLEAGVGSEESAGGFHYLDAVADDVAVKARVVARFHLAAATKLNARDVVFLDPEITKRIVSSTGDEYRAHDAAKAALATAFPTEGMKWGEIVEALGDLGTKAPASVLALRQAIEQRLASAPGLAEQVAL